MLKIELEKFIKEVFLNPDSELNRRYAESDPAYRDGQRINAASLLMDHIIANTDWYKRRGGIYGAGVVGGANSLEITSKMLEMANTTGDATESLRHLEALMAAKDVRVSGVLVVFGLTCYQRLRLTPDVELVPLLELDPCVQRDRLFENMMRSTQVRNVEMLQGHGAALVKTGTLANFRAPINAAPPREDSIFLLELEDILPLLGVLPNAVPREGARWLVFHDTDIQLYSKQGGMSFVTPNVATCVVQSASEVDTLIRNYQCLPKATKSGIDQRRIKLAMARYIRSKQHPYSDLENRSIDLAIAFEALTLTDGSIKDELKYRIRIRVARLLRSGLAERHIVKGYMGALYDARSGGVHGGQPDEQYNVLPVGAPDRKRHLYDILNQTDGYFIELVTKILGPQVPVWEDIELA